jgi:membrane protein involved in colicin uptake
MVRWSMLFSLLVAGLTFLLPNKAVAQEMCPCGCGMPLSACNPAKCSIKAAMLQRQAEAEANARAQAEAQARAEAEQRARQQAEAQARQQAEAQAKAEAEAKAQARAKQDAQADQLTYDEGAKKNLPQAQADAKAEERQQKAQEERDHIKSVAGSYLKSQGIDLDVKDEYRPNSAAHMRGAIDISSKDLSPEQRATTAKGISDRLGNGYTVIVEEVSEDGKTQTNTSYRNGKMLNRHTNQPKTATATHTHIQPDPPPKTDDDK